MPSIYLRLDWAVLPQHPGDRGVARALIYNYGEPVDAELVFRFSPETFVWRVYGDASLDVRSTVAEVSVRLRLRTGTTTVFVEFDAPSADEVRVEAVLRAGGREYRSFVTATLTEPFSARVSVSLPRQVWWPGRPFVVEVSYDLRAAGDAEIRGARLHVGLLRGGSLYVCRSLGIGDVPAGHSKSGSVRVDLNKWCFFQVAHETPCGTREVTVAALVEYVGCHRGDCRPAKSDAATATAKLGFWVGGGSVEVDAWGGLEVGREYGARVRFQAMGPGTGIPARIVLGYIDRSGSFRRLGEKRIVVDTCGWVTVDGFTVRLEPGTVPSAGYTRHVKLRAVIHGYDWLADAYIPLKTIDSVYPLAGAPAPPEERPPEEKPPEEEKPKPERPNPVIVDLRYPRTVEAGNPVAVDVTVENRGGGGTVFVRLSSDRVFIHEGERVNVVYESRVLGEGEKWTVTFTIVLPEPGVYKFLVQTGTDGRVTNEQVFEINAMQPEEEVPREERERAAGLLTALASIATGVAVILWGVRRGGGAPGAPA